jgi:hypothetical protein
VLQGRYLHYENVYAAIGMIGVIGLTTDMILAWLATVLFPWKRRRSASRRPARPRVRIPAEMPPPGAVEGSLVEFPKAGAATVDETANPLRTQA